MSNLMYMISYFIRMHIFPVFCIYTSNFRIDAFIHHNINFKEGVPSLV